MVPMAVIALACCELVVYQVPIAPQAAMVDGNGFPYGAGDAVIR